MTKAKGLFFTAGIALATLFTFSCSSDGGLEGGGGLNLSGLPKEVWLVETGYDNNDNFIIRQKDRYNGNADISVLFSDIQSQSCGGGKCECTNYNGDVFECEYDYEYDTVQAGKIQGGQLQLNLSASVNSKYLRKMESCNDSERCQISVVPKNLTYGRKSSLFATVSGRSNCRLRGYLIKPGKTDETQFFYFSESGKVTGTEGSAHIDMNVSKGWNLVYYEGYDNYVNITTNLPKDGALEWWLECRD